MKDEIKEILYVLKHIVIGRASRLTPREADKLLDYITNLQQELERYKNIIEIMERYFELIIDLSFDYDGLNEVKSLKVLIDELNNYASLGRVYNTTEPIYENNGKKYNILNEELKGE